MENALTDSTREAREGHMAVAYLEVATANSAVLANDLADQIAARPKVEQAAPVFRKRVQRPSSREWL